MCRGNKLGNAVSRRCQQAVLLLAALTAAPLASAPAQDPVDYYRQNCMSCHTIGGGRLTGPDLKDVTERQDRPWLVNFLRNPPAVLASGDPYARRILEEARGVPMPAAPGMTGELAGKLLDLIEAESKLDESRFKGVPISTEPFTPRDVARGRQLFRGTGPLSGGGAACIACHSMYDSRALGGGRLGPDLTGVYDRLQGRQALSAWLAAPGTPTMQPVFKSHPLTRDEIHSLVAYFEQASAQPPADPTASRLTFLLLGLAGAAGLMFAFDGLWKWRFRGVRKALIESAKAKGGS